MLFSEYAMKQSIKVIVDGVLILAILALSVQWMMKPRQKMEDFTLEPHENVKIQDTETNVDVGREIVAQPEQVARLFGWSNKGMKPDKEHVSNDSTETVPKEGGPEVVSYLRYIGYVVDALGEETHFVKETNTGQVISLRMNAVHGSWRLLEISETSILIEKDDTLYKILLESSK